MILDSRENKQKILAKFLEISAFEGWNNKALAQALNSCEIDEKFQNLIFENGCLSLIEFYIETQILKIEDAIAQNENFQSLKVRQKIKFALETLFENEKSNQISLQRLQNFYLDLKNFSNIENGPKPLFMAFKHVAKISDAIWFAINDQSTDFNFYTKRLTLSKIILCSFGVFIKDNSPHLEKTKKFIDLQIEKVMKFEKAKMQIKNLTKKMAQKSQDFFHDEIRNIKSPSDILRNLPFIRLFK